MATATPSPGTLLSSNFLSHCLLPLACIIHILSIKYFGSLSGSYLLLRVNTVHQTSFVQRVACSNGDSFQLPPTAVESGGRYNVYQLMRGTKNEKMEAKWCVRKVCAHQKVYMLLEEEAKGQTKSAHRWLKAQEHVLKEKVRKTWQSCKCGNLCLNAELGIHSEDNIFLCQLGYVTLNLVVNN